MDPPEVSTDTFALRLPRAEPSRRCPVLFAPRLRIRLRRRGLQRRRGASAAIGFSHHGRIRPGGLGGPPGQQASHFRNREQHDELKRHLERERC